MAKATYIGKMFEDGICYGLYEYKGQTYEVCFNTFYCYKSLAEQHREEQSFIDRQIELSKNKATEPAQVGLDLFFKEVGI